MKSILGSFFVGFLWSAPAHAAQGIIPCNYASLSVSGSSSNTQLSNCGGTVILWNTGSQEAFYNFGTSSGTTATASPSSTSQSYSLPGNSFVVLNLGLGQYYLAAITGSSTTTLRITQGVTQ